MVLRTAGRASHPATVRGAGRMREGSPLGPLGVTSGFRNLLAPARAGRGNFLLPGRCSRELRAVKGRVRPQAAVGGTAPAALTARAPAGVVRPGCSLLARSGRVPLAGRADSPGLAPCQPGGSQKLAQGRSLNRLGHEGSAGSRTERARL